jgi:hypothetical protein
MSVKTAFICLLDPWICPCCGMWKNFVKISSKRERKFFFFFFLGSFLVVCITNLNN